MSHGVQHRIVCVGLDQEVLASLTPLLLARGGKPTVVRPDIDSAREDAEAHSTEGHLFIVQVAPGDDLARLSTLTTGFPGQPILALLPTGSDIPRVLATQRAGAAQVVTLPLREADFLQALDCLLLQFAPSPREALVLAVCGVSGGAGATTLALNLACEIARTTGDLRRNVLLVELARGMGTLATYLDISPKLTTHELVRDSGHLSTAAVRRAVSNVMPGLDVLVGPYDEITPGSITPRNVFQLIELCRKMASVVVLDVPCTLDDLQFETLTLADQVALVGVQSVSSIRTLEMLRDTLEREQGIHDLTLVLNRYEPAVPGFSSERIAQLLDVPMVFTVANDPSVMAAQNYAKPLLLAAPHSPVLADIRRLAARMTGTTSPPAEPGDRLQRALSKPSGPRPPRPLRVLHIEDDPFQQQVVALRLGALEEFVVSITSATSESAAIALYSRQPFDLVLLDYHLEQGNGLGCLRQLRVMDQNVPILVVSGVNQPQIAAELISAGADDFLSKETLANDQLSRSMSVAIARADAFKLRLGVTSQPARPDTVVELIRATFSGEDLAELMNSLVELHRVSHKGRFSAAQIQRLVDLVCGELDRTPGDALPRRAILSLFLRLFSPQTREAAT